MKMIRKILLCAGTGLLLSTGSLQSVPGGIFHMDTAYGAESSIIETMSIKFNTTFGDPEEIPQDQGYPLGIFITKQNMKTGNLVKRYGWRSLWMLHRESISLCPLDDPNAV